MKFIAQLLVIVCSAVLLINSSVFAGMMDNVNGSTTRGNTLTNYDESDEYIIIKERYHGESRDIERRSVVEDLPQDFSVLDYYSLDELAELVGLSMDEILEIKNNDFYDFDKSMVVLLEGRSFGAWYENQPNIGIKEEPWVLLMVMQKGIL